MTDAVAALLNPIVGEVDADLDLISQRLAMSRRSLQQVLNSEGASFRDILLGVRIGRAKDLIADGTHALSEVALSVGYSDQAHFTRAFKTATGSTPKEFQQSIFAPGRARGSDDLNGGASAP